MAQSSSLANIVILFAVIENSPGSVIRTLSDNARFLFTPPLDIHDGRGGGGRWQGGQAKDFTDVFAFQFQENIHSPRGWIAGSASTDDCDFKLAPNNQTGISGFHFCIDINPKNFPRIVNLCRNGIRVQRSGETKFTILRKDDEIEIDRPLLVDLGAAALQMWRPNLTQEEDAMYRTNAEAFHSDYMQALPRPLHNSGAARTLDVRFGLNQAVYHKVTSQQPRSGAFGSVIKVAERNKQKFFAAKIPHLTKRPSAKADREQWEMIHAEFRKLMRLQHENIVKTVEILPGTLGSEPPWLIMEWVELSLYSYVPPASEIPSLLRQISVGLAYMHNQGFTHRDLKPENILIRHEGPNVVVKIADVGLAKYAVDSNMHSYAGTLLYMAPELWDTEQGYTNAVDLWSFGIIVLELLTSWDIRHDGPGADGAPPSETRHRNWIRTSVLPRQNQAPLYKTLLNGLLSLDVRARWTASECQRWLVRDERELQLENSSWVERDRYTRSMHPTLSTPGASSLPDTEPWGSGREGSK
ncbi:hypothetical protein ARSEF4850_009209 [Beauveria asiatica]